MSLDRRTLADQLAALFDDGGAEVLLAAGRPVDWEALLAELPEALLQDRRRGPVQVLTLARDLLGRQGDETAALALTRGLVAHHRTHSGPEHPDALAEQGALGVLLLRAGQPEEGERLLEQSYRGLRSRVGGRDLRFAVVAGNLGLHYAVSGRLEEAAHCLGSAVKCRQREAPQTVATTAGQLGEVLLRLGRVDEGIDALRQAWMCELDTHGERHPQTLRRMYQLAQTLNKARLFREAVAHWRTLDEVARAGGQAEQRAAIGFELGYALCQAHRVEEGRRRMAEALRWTREVSRDGAPHPQLAPRLAMFAQLEARAGRAHEAEGLMREAVEAERRASGEDSAATARRWADLGMLLGRMGRVDEALGTLDNAALLLLSTVGPQAPEAIAAVEATLGLIAGKAEAMLAARDKSTAAELLRHGLGLAGPVLGYDHEALRALRAIAATHRLHVDG